MPTHEKIAVVAAVLAALGYLARSTVAKYRSRNAGSQCAGCGCAKALEPAKPD